MFAGILRFFPKSTNIYSTICITGCYKLVQNTHTFETCVYCTLDWRRTVGDTSPTSPTVIFCVQSFAFRVDPHSLRLSTPPTPEIIGSLQLLDGRAGDIC